MNEKTMTVEDDLHFEQMIAEESVCTKENLVYERPETLTDATMHYCPGCGHGVAHRIIAEVIDELDIQKDT
ncbi:MAG: 2-oxoglutarate oxidoreductase, partial [Ignavibacteria bacterium]|nr:2-oxoglutarate oxidoreductase [Ignavibacteria bacterium]